MSKPVDNTECDLCPVCEKNPLNGARIVNPIIGEICSFACLENYWSGKREANHESEDCR